MKILIAGASGFIGTRLVAALQPFHKVTVLGRDESLLRSNFQQLGIQASVANHSSSLPGIDVITWNSIAQMQLDAREFDAIINLCGYNIAASRWNAKVKKELIKSRVHTTTQLTQWAIRCAAKPHILCANAVGIYGLQNTGDEQVLDEDSLIDFQHPKDFLSEIGVRWQECLQPAINAGMAVTTARFGVVLGKEGGVLKKLHPIYNLGLGNIVGDGKQIMSWVYINDLITALMFLLKNPQLTGAYNVTSPAPVTQAEFATTFAKVLRRPLFLKMPEFMIRLLFGEMGETLLLKGQRVYPKRLIESGFKFEYSDLENALKKEYAGVQ